MERHIVQHYRTDIKGNIPSSDILEAGEIGLNISKGGESIYIKNSENEIIEFKDKNYVDSLVNKLITNSGHTHDERYYTKSEVDIMLSGYVSIDIVEQMIKDAISRIDGGIINPDTPVEPDTPEEPTVDNIGEINENNEIIINEELLSSGTYTLKYIDSYDQVVDNFKPITNFTI